MSQDSLDNFKAYTLAMELFDLVVDDVTPLANNSYWFSEEVVIDRTERCSHILAILTKTIVSLKKRGGSQ